MKHLNEFSPLNEGKEVDLEKEQQNQASLREKLTLLDKNISLLDSSKKKEADKMLEKSKMIATKAKLYGELAKSFQKESMLMGAVAQNKKKI